ncbi:hypothetical protein J0676_18035 [Vibrio sp. Vb2880]|uniref:hypothetical protein n=1 Tax=Vibrio sp. Vb2880 TaxID=2816076 RepID=UPI001A8FB942|nr:hypothetical protein [Vibrio sp. Vb2880]MBO0215410.1 hypothetical protein [Vibrio sp. Vb2880]
MDKKIKLILLGFKTDYYDLEAQSLSDHYDVNNVKIGKFLDIFFRKIFLLSRPLFGFFAFVLFLVKVGKVKNAVIVCYDNKPGIYFLNSRYFKNSRKILMMKNLYKDYNFPIELNDIEIYSYDQSDCDYYGFKKYNSYCSGEKYLRENVKNVEQRRVYFLGRDKGRSELLSNLINSNPRIDFNIIIVDDHKGILSNVLGKNGYVPYVKHLDNILSSEVVIDFVNEEQSVITMRTIEALISNKKIVTNNKSVRNFDCYSKERFLIIDDSFMIPEEFIETKISPLNQEVLNDFGLCKAYNTMLGE